ncbi:MAG: GxxExxY protein [Planctomycetes bacterium]|nr:GxxExxY protein [Planctomycetota bacterium]MCB9935448.1 GxxExxY protein [Planctomycetota bacterium]
MQEPEDRIAAVVYELGEMIHRRLGPGLYESVYRDILAFELRKRGYKVALEVPVPLIWEDLRFDRTYAADIVAEDLVVVEVKAVAEQHPIHKAQALTHTRLLNKRLGLVVNFGLLLFKTGFQRAANGMPE